MKAADRMFYEACRTDGCEIPIAAKLYAGVRYGSWKRSRRRVAMKSGVLKIPISNETFENDKEKHEFLNKLKGLGAAIEKGDLDKIDSAFPIE